MHQIFITMKVINFAKQNTIVNQYVAELGYRAFCTKGVPATVHLCCVIAVQKGVDYIKKAFSRHDNIMLWCATIARTFMNIVLSCRVWAMRVILLMARKYSIPK